MTQPPSPPTASAAEKAALREAVLAARNAISGDARAHAGAAVAEVGAALVARLAPARVSVFVSFRGEVDTNPLMEALDAAGVPLCLPVIVSRGAPLVFRAWRPGDALETKRFGLLEPGEDAPDVTPDLLFVPLAAFDARGFRLGYGGGFYDRTLGKLRTAGEATALGLAFAMQQVADVPTDAYDQPLDGVLTERGFLPVAGALLPLAGASA